MLKRTRSRTGAATRTARKRNLPRRSARSKPAKPGLDRSDAPERAPTSMPNSMDWADPLTEEELRELEAGWGFVE